MTKPISAGALAALLSLIVAPLLAAEVPKVVLSNQHQQMCKVGVGDAMPPLQLSGADGQEQALKDRIGKQATVVAFVGYEHWMNPALLQDLVSDVVADYEGKGVTTTVVRVGDSPVKAPQGSPLMFINATDEEFAKLGSGRMPRVYLLNAEGKIVWFDIEYSESTRRELKQTLKSLTEGAAN